MARNETLREVARKLPPMNKVTADGKLMYDEKGRTVKTDHFKEMLKLKADLEAVHGRPKNKEEWAVRHRLELEAMSRYSLGVQTIHKKLMQKKRVQIIKKIISGMSITVFLLYIWYHYF